MEKATAQVAFFVIHVVKLAQDKQLKRRFLRKYDL